MIHNKYIRCGSIHVQIQKYSCLFDKFDQMRSGGEFEFQEFPSGGPCRCHADVIVDPLCIQIFLLSDLKK